MFSKNLASKIGFVFLLGTKDRYVSAENRITIFCNVFGIFGALGSIVSYLQLVQLNITGYYLLNYFFISATAIFLLILNAKRYHIAARFMSVLLLNLTAWHALIFFGKSFNGFHLFFVAIVFSVIAFSQKYWHIRWLSLFVSLLGLPLSDYLSHRKLLPITGLNSSQFPLSILLFDTIVVSGFLIFILLIEKFLSEKNERELLSLNKDLEEIVAKRTMLLDEAKQEAQAANRAKSRFIANTSHELRTPLGSIIGYVELLLDTNPNENIRRQYLEVIHRSGNQLLQIVNEVLDLSKIEAEKLEINNQAFILSELINDVQDLMSLKAESKGLLLTFESPLPQKPIYLYSDPLRLKQILVNLIGNAIKFTSRGEIRVNLQIIRKIGTSCTLLCDIIDTGPGIDKEHANYLFQPFSQGDSTLVRKHGGSGLGLALSKNLAQLLNGDLILLQSEVGKGSTFRLTIDCNVIENLLTPTKLLNREKNPQQKQSLIGKKILVVDDSIDNQILVGQYLTLAGAKVDIAENGQKALSLIEKSSSYDAVLMDLQMPILDGYETTHLLRQQGYATPIIAFTAHAMSEERNKSKESGFNDYLTKPIRRQALISAIEDILSPTI